EAGVVVEAEVTGDRPAVLEDLGCERVLVLGDVAELLEQREVHVRLHVAHGAGIAVPVPRAADVARLLDQTDALEPSLAEPGAGEQSAEPGADDGDVDVVEERI